MARPRYAFITFDSGLYEEDTALALANIFDIGVNCCKLPGQDVVGAFVASGLAREFEAQNPSYVAGKSAVELFNLLADFLDVNKLGADVPRFNRTPDYWLGWVLGLYQVRTGRPYARIFEVVPYGELIAMYKPLHEAPESKFIETLNERLAVGKGATNLRRIRGAAGLSQRELAYASGVSLRSIQMYEQRNKDINCAQCQTIFHLAQALHCSMESILER